jgi:AraC-like DNA-binding protein
MEGDIAMTGLWNEQDRIAALHRYEILNSKPEADFSDFVQIASDICDAPIAATNLTDGGRHWALTGIEHGDQGLPLIHSICAQAIRPNDLFPDATGTRHGNAPQQSQRNLAIADVANARGLSRGYFIRAFNETTGQTPHRWILSQRAERAREWLLGSELILVDVALSGGFSDQSHFTRIFSRMTGMLPGGWRRVARS